MTNFDTLLRDAVREAAEIPATDLGARALAGAARRRLRQYAIAGAAVIVALVAAVGLIRIGPSLRPVPILTATPAATTPGRWVVASYRTDGRARFLDPVTGRYLSRDRGALALSPDLRYVVETRAMDGFEPTRYSLALVEVATDKVLHRWDAENVSDVAWSPDGRRLAVSEVDGPDFEDLRVETVILVDLKLGTTDELDVHGRPRRLMGWSGDGKRLYFEGFDDPPGRPWRYSVLSINGDERSAETSVPAGYVPESTADAGLGDLAVVRPLSGGGSWRVLNLHTGRIVREYRPSVAVQAVLGRDNCQSALDAALVMIGCSGRLQIINPATGQTVRILVLPKGADVVEIRPAPASLPANHPLAFTVP